MNGFFNRNFWKVAGSMLAIYAGTLAVSTAIGLTLSDKLTAKRTAWFDRPPEVLWRAVIDRQAEPSWRPELLSVAPQAAKNGRSVWRETYWTYQKIDLEEVERSDGERRRERSWVWDNRAGKLVLKAVERQTPRRLVQYMSFQALPVLAGGSRTLDVRAEKGGSLVTIQEEKTVRVPPFRTWARIFVLPQLATVTVDRYLDDLGQKLGSPPQKLA